MLYEQNDGLAVRRYLDGSQGDAFCDHVPGRTGNRRAAETHAHAVGCFGDMVGELVKFVAEPRRLWAGRDV